jgi:hypothetical protein
VHEPGVMKYSNIQIFGERRACFYWLSIYVLEITVKKIESMGSYWLVQTMGSFILSEMVPYRFFMVSIRDLFRKYLRIISDSFFSKFYVMYFGTCPTANKSGEATEYRTKVLDIYTDYSFLSVTFISGSALMDCPGAAVEATVPMFPLVSVFGSLL